MINTFADSSLETGVKGERRTVVVVGSGLLVRTTSEMVSEWKECRQVQSNSEDATSERE